MKQFVVLVACLAIFCVQTAEAVPITVPTGLASGEQYRLVFVTTGTTNSTSSDIAYYDTFVANEANSVPELYSLGTTWQVIGSTSSVDARDHTGTNPNVSVGVPVYLLNDTMLAASNADLWDGAVLVPLNVSSGGEVLQKVDYVVWTGTLADGKAAVGYALGSLGSNTEMGSWQSERWWVDTGWSNKTQPRSLYGISGVLTVPVQAPEPSTLLLLGSGLVGLVVFRRKFQK